MSGSMESIISIGDDDKAKKYFHQMLTDFSAKWLQTKQTSHVKPPPPWGNNITWLHLLRSLNQASHNFSSKPLCFWWQHNPAAATTFTDTVSPLATDSSSIISTSIQTMVQPTNMTQQAQGHKGTVAATVPRKTSRTEAAAGCFKNWNQYHTHCFGVGGDHHHHSGTVRATGCQTWAKPQSGSHTTKPAIQYSPLTQGDLLTQKIVNPCRPGFPRQHIVCFIQRGS